MTRRRGSESHKLIGHENCVGPKGAKNAFTTGPRWFLGYPPGLSAFRRSSPPLTRPQRVDVVCIQIEQGQSRFGLAWSAVRKSCANLLIRPLRLAPSSWKDALLAGSLVARVFLTSRCVWLMFWFRPVTWDIRAAVFWCLNNKQNAQAVESGEIAFVWRCLPYDLESFAHCAASMWHSLRSGCTCSTVFRNEAHRSERCSETANAPSYWLQGKCTTFHFTLTVLAWEVWIVEPSAQLRSTRTTALLSCYIRCEWLRKMWAIFAPYFRENPARHLRTLNLLSSKSLVSFVVCIEKILKSCFERKLCYSGTRYFSYLYMFTNKHFCLWLQKRFRLTWIFRKCVGYCIGFCLNFIILI